MNPKLAPLASNTRKSGSRVVVGVSGGVDSSVAALLLRGHGYDVQGVFMKNWEDSYEPGYCAAAEDLKDAEEVCASLNIPLHKVNFSSEYYDYVFRYFLKEYRRGRTPNPDVVCNKEIKFKALQHYARRLGADYIATGHYARVEKYVGNHSAHKRLFKGSDSNKDQSYFLYSLSQEQLATALFPLGSLTKHHVRQLAREADLITHDKKDSTGICFIGERKFRAFLQRYLSTQPGEMRTPDGQLVGQHLGLSFYTLGQRQGLGIGGRRDDTGKPWYVVDKDLKNNRLIVAQGNDHPLLFHHRLRASQVHWITGHSPPIPFHCQAKVRYRQTAQDCTITTLTADTCLVVFREAQRAITPGQSVVFYVDDECLGGGIIEAAFD